MNFFKRGLTSIVRRPGKTIILLLLIFVLSNVIAGAIAAKSALANTEKALLNSVGVEVTIEIDYNSIWEKQSDGIYEIPSVTPEMVKQIGKSEHVRSFDYSIGQWIESKNLLYYPKNDYGFKSFEFKGGQNTSIIDMQSNDISLKDGRVYTQEEINNGSNVILISDKLAELNNLSVGSKVVFVYNFYDYSKDYPVEDDWGRDIGFDKDIAIDGDIGWIEPELIKTLELEYEVIGIFSAKNTFYTDYEGNLVEQESSLVSVIYTTNNTISNCQDAIAAESLELGQQYEPYYDIRATFLLKSLDIVDVFESQNKQYLDDGLYFSNNAASFDSFKTPMANVSWIANIIMWVAIGATVLIISLLVTLFLRDRKHEMGIYLALGEKKALIASQILTEVLLIAVIAVSLSVFSGQFIAQQMSETMLKNQLVEEQKNNSGGGWITPMSSPDSSYSISIGRPIYPSTSPAVSSDEVMEVYEVSLDAKTILFIYVIGMGSVLISTLIPIVYTLGLKPKKILM